MNILYIDVDSLRHDHVGCYGYDKPTTPNIDLLAEDSVRFDRFYVANSPCLPSRAAWISGRYGIHNGVDTHGKTAQHLRDPKVWDHWFAAWSEDWSGASRNALAEWNGESANWLTLPEVFFHERVRTCAVSSFPRHTAPYLYHVWHEFHQPQEPEGPNEYMQTPRGKEVVDISIDFLDRTDEEFFLYAQTWDPHTPYNRTDEEVEKFRFDPDKLPPHPTEEEITKHRSWEWSSARHIGIDGRGDLAELYANYDAEIRYADRHIGRLIEYLKEHDLYDETFIVVTADHGEELGETGLYRQHGTTHDGTQHVPLIVKPPSKMGFEPGERNHLVTNVDMAPTLVDYAGLDCPGSWQGESLRPILLDADADGRDFIVIDHGLYTAQRAVRTDRWKYIRTYHPGVLTGIVPERQLYDMKADPLEQADVAENNADIVAELDERMVVWAEAQRGDHEDTIRKVARNGPPAYLAGEAYWGEDISTDVETDR